MIFWQTGGDLINLGEIQKNECPVCEKERTFNFILSYRYFALYWIFGVLTKKKYMLCCDICERGVELETKKADNFINSLDIGNPIPFMRRCGLLVGIGLAFFCIVVFVPF